MKTSLKTCLSLLWTTALILLLPVQSRGADADKSPAAPAGSLIIRGSPKAAKETNSSPAAWIGSPEHSLGLAIEQAMKTNGYQIIVRAFNLDVLQHRYVPSLPTSDEFKEKLYTLPANVKWKQQVFTDAVFDIEGRKVKFLGVRSYAGDNELLFRDNNGPMYVGYVVQRDIYGGVRIVDTHRFERGELQSQSMRRQTLIELARKKLIVPPLRSGDQALLSGSDALTLFESRCDYGHYNLIKEAYEKLPAEIQEDRSVLFRYVTSGEQSLNDIMVPVERWRKVYPEDPVPNLQVVNFYWRLYSGPPYIPDGPNRGTYLGSELTPGQEEGLVAAIQRANAWFADPAMEIRMAGYFGSREPVKAKALLEQAMKRFPVEPSAFAAMRKINLAGGDFSGVANLLHLEEAATQKDLSGMVNSSKDYVEFRKSFACKKWLHDYHGADAKALAAGE